MRMRRRSAKGTPTKQEELKTLANKDFLDASKPEEFVILKRRKKIELTSTIDSFKVDAQYHCNKGA